MSIKLYMPITALLIFFHFSVVAQNIAIGIQGGVSSRNLTNGASLSQLLTSGNHFVIAPNFGIFAEFKYSATFSLQPSIEYSAQGSKNGTFKTGINTPHQESTNSSNRAELNYLILPVLAKFGWNFQESPVRFYIAAGPFAGVLLSAKQTVFDSSPNAVNGEDVRAYLHSFNAGIQAKVGLIYILGRGNLSIEGGGNFGALKIQNAIVPDKNNTGSLIISIGYSYWLGADFRTSNNPIRL
ncbi:PorT family protein [Mucilaginibacter sp. RB4R14]|uniref:porin family protein n=1 Tax=Mucilaginibacter aurantiaciroseus TaxID=2949308 RepID=UPI002090ED0B|nr:porin family protein [Mucilaginibacter aurantiaciroseus]MCO5934666.1 PorT family protein [Mucilaginibacter aurantiaciroseus]